MLTIYNSLTQQKEPFQPIEPGKIKLYACGMTVYDYCHIGHARSWVVFDVIVRYLRSCGWEVTYVRNITDVDDKIIQRAHDNHESTTALTERFIRALHEDETALGIVAADHEPRATEYIASMIALIQTLITQGHAYVAGNGDVCFDVHQFKAYGKLSRRDIHQLRSCVRVEINESKRDPLDFVLWKMAKPGEPQWPSPWGVGRPGWHIECSAMSSHLLGQPFDLHGGGMDLKFPHHENEIAQSEAAVQRALAKGWVHVGLLQTNQEKMSKSLGNILLIRDALQLYSAEVWRYFFLSSHYRSPVNYSQDIVSTVRHALSRLYIAVRDLPEAKETHLADSFVKNFHVAMEDDFNVPEALAVLFALAREINRLREQHQQAEAASLGATLKRLAGLFGFLQQDPDYFLRGTLETEALHTIETLIRARDQARATKDWARADRIRGQLLAMGIVIEDTAQGTVWRREQ